MTTFVVDTSVCIKWFIPENLWQPASSLLDPRFDLHAPDLIYSELGNVLWKKTLRKEITSLEALEIVACLKRTPLIVHAADVLIEQALSIAIRTGRSVYDCLYLALACQIDARMVTSDQRLLNALHDTEYRRHVVWIGDPQEFPGFLPS